MRIGILADVHGCLGALRETLAAFDPAPDGGLVCLGDLVGAGNDSEGCVEELRRRGAVCVLGRHDEEALRTGRPPLRDETARWLRALPLQFTVGGVLLVHDNPIARPRLAKGLWRRGTFVRHLLAAQVVFEEAEVFRADPQALVAIGHTHVPAVFSPQEDVPLAEGHPVVLRPDTPYLLNPGSVGYSPDGRAAHAGIVDTRARTFTVIRVPTRTLVQADYRPPEE